MKEQNKTNGKKGIRRDYIYLFFAGAVRTKLLREIQWMCITCGELSIWMDSSAESAALSLLRTREGRNVSINPPTAQRPELLWVTDAGWPDHRNSFSTPPLPPPSLHSNTTQETIKVPQVYRLKSTLCVSHRYTFNRLNRGPFSHCSLWENVILIQHDCATVMEGRLTKWNLSTVYLDTNFSLDKR